MSQTWTRTQVNGWVFAYRYNKTDTESCRVDVITRGIYITHESPPSDCDSGVSAGVFLTGCRLCLQERAGSVAQLSSSGRRLPGSTRSDRRSGGSFATHLSQSSLLRHRRLPDVSPLLAVAPGSGDSGDSSPSDDDAAAVEEYLRRVASAPPAFIDISVPVIPQPASHNLTTHRQMGRQLAQKPETVRLIHACTPFRALSLQPLQELPSPAGLPLTSSMRRMGLRCSTLQEVLHMKLPAAAAAKPTGVKPTSLASSVASIGRAKRRHRQASLASSGSLMSF